MPRYVVHVANDAYSEHNGGRNQFLSILRGENTPFRACSPPNQVDSNLPYHYRIGQAIVAIDLNYAEVLEARNVQEGERWAGRATLGGVGVRSR